MAGTGATTPEFVSQAPRLGFIGGFDGVRGIGILMVLMNHGYSDLSPSFAGIIDVFFVMSAFLITSLLLQEHRDRGGIDMRKFYSRRAVRLLPSAYLCIAAWFVVTILFARERLSTLTAEAAAAVTYVYQFVFPVGLGAVDPAATEHLSIDQFWSLAVEEQFYLVIAVTVLVCIRRRWMVQLAVGMVALATYIGVARWFGQTGPWPGGPTNSSIPARGLSLLWLSRPDSLMWGVALAVVNARLPDPLPAIWRKWLPRIGLVGLVVGFTSMLIASGFLNDAGRPIRTALPLRADVPTAPGRRVGVLRRALLAEVRPQRHRDRLHPGDPGDGTGQGLVGEPVAVVEADPVPRAHVLHAVRVAHPRLLHRARPAGR